MRAIEIGIGAACVLVIGLGVSAVIGSAIIDHREHGALRLTAEPDTLEVPPVEVHATGVSFPVFCTSGCNPNGPPMPRHKPKMTRRPR